MVSKKRINYQWRLFIPQVILLWLIIGILVRFQYRREAEYRAETITTQLGTISQRIVKAYERDADLGAFIHFLDIYIGNSTFDDIMVSVYDDDGNLMYRIGDPILQTDRNNHQTPELAEAEQHGQGNVIRNSLIAPNKIFYYSAIKSNDGKLYVHTAMPYTGSISTALTVDPIMWLMVVLLALAATTVAYLSAKFLSRNITLLKEFADRAAENKDFVATDRFPHDELGDISRQIVRIYTEKDNALQKSEREHRIALRATEEKARIKRQLTNNINHELKTPISIIKGYVDAIVDSPDMPENMRTKFLVKTQDQIQRICTLLNDVSTMTRLDEAGITIPTAEIDIMILFIT
jgi:signal transduction histidine kinase